MMEVSGLEFIFIAANWLFIGFFIFVYAVILVTFLPRLNGRGRGRGRALIGGSAAGPGQAGHPPCPGLRIPMHTDHHPPAVAEAAAKSRQDIAKEYPRTIPVLISPLSMKCCAK